MSAGPNRQVNDIGDFRVFDLWYDDSAQIVGVADVVVPAGTVLVRSAAGQYAAYSAGGAQADAIATEDVTLGASIGFTSVAISGKVRADRIFDGAGVAISDLADPADVSAAMTALQTGGITAIKSNDFSKLDN